MGICRFKKQQMQDLKTNNQQVIYKIKKEKQASEEDRYLHFHNWIKYKSHQQYWKAEISNDEKYLAIFGSKFKKIKIYYLKFKKIIKNLKLEIKENNNNNIKFSNNSSYLLIGDYYGYLYCYDINSNFKLIYYQKIHSHYIIDILPIDDDQILTGSYDSSLIITHIKSNQQLLKIDNIITFWIHPIDFDKSNDFIISCANETSIMFFNRKDGKCYIKKQNAHQYRIQMIQLISQDNNLISSSLFQLILWQIDYKRLQLNKLKEFNDLIYSFTSVLNNNKIVVICHKSIQILDKDLVVLQSIKQNICIVMIQGTRQLNSLNYIIIPGSDDFLIQKKVRKLLK